MWESNLIISKDLSRSTSSQEISRAKIGLALSGGASRGVAHLGVLKAFSEHDIKLDFIAGTSAGAFIGALYAFGVSIEELLEQADNMSWTKIASFSLSKNAILSNKIIGEVVEKFVGSANIEDAPMPLFIIATDISTGEKIVLRKGNLAQAIMASTCIPGIFSPINIDGRLLVDGFLVSNLPVSSLKEAKADIIIGVNLNNKPNYREPNGIINIVMNAFEIAIDANTFIKKESSDILIEPDVSDISVTNWTQNPTLFEVGYMAGVSAIPQIKATIIRKQKKINRKRKYSFWKKIKNLPFINRLANYIYL